MAPKKNQKMSLGDFLGDQSLGSWADEMEDMPVATETRSGYGGGFGGERRAFTAPGMGERSFSNRGYPPREQLPLPTKPPFTAHLGNLSFDATEGDVQDFFHDCGVQNVRIVEDKLEHKPKGFGYVEFTSLDGLKKALEKDGDQFQGRNIRLSVADPPKDRPEARELNDWTRKGPLPDLPQQNQQRRPSDRGFSRGYEPPNVDTGSERGGGPRRQGTFNDDGKPRDFGNWERKGPLSPLPASAGGPPREGRVRSHEGQTPRERRLSPAWGEGTNRSQDGGSRPPRGELRERAPVERAPTAAEMDNQWRARMKPDASQKSSTPTPDASAPSSPAQPAPPATRPKLNLQKRTVSEAEPSPTTAQTDSKASPFGAARPIDTAAREREIEEKRQLAIRQRKEVEAKEREERKAKAEKEKGERAATAKEAGVSPIQEDGKSDADENGEEKPAAVNYEILRRVHDEEENGAEGEEDGTAQDAPANGTIVEDKAVKPKEVVRDAPRQQGGSWRRPSRPSNAGPNTPATPTADSLEEDGWSTVPAKERKGRGRGGARAVAS